MRDWPETENEWLRKKVEGLKADVLAATAVADDAIKRLALAEAENVAMRRDWQKRERQLRSCLEETEDTKRYWKEKALMLEACIGITDALDWGRDG